MSDNASAAAAAAGGQIHLTVEESEQAAVLALAAAAAARKVGGAAGTDGSSPLAAGPPTKSLNSGALSGGDAISALSEDDTDDDPSDQQVQGGLFGQRNSGSLSNLASADWRGGHTSEGLPQTAPTPVQQQQQQQQQQQAALPYAAQHGLEAARQAALMQQAMAQAAAAAAAQHNGQARDATPSTARGRRNARQQEQNKQAQQRYRAKRKAQFEELQRRVQHLTAESQQHQRLRQENDRLRADVTRLTALLHAATAAAPPGAAAAAAVAATAAAAAAAAAGDLSAPLSSANMPDGAAQPAAAQQLQAQQRQQQPTSGGSGTDPGSQLVGSAKPSSSAAFGGNGAFKPTAAVRPLAPSTLAELPQAGSQPLSALGPLGQPSGRQVHAALDLFYRDLQGFATTVQLEHVPADGAGLGAEAALRLTELVRTGLELVKLVLQTSGTEAAALLTAGLPSVGADGASPADSLAQWRMVAARVGLTAEQHALLADWRRRFLQKLDDCYGRRLLHKAQLAQLPGGGGAAAPPGQPPQWVEALLLQAAESVGFSACALAGAQLEGVVTALHENLREERAAAGAMMAELLDRILTKVQAARFLLAGHPFCWNGLSFALAAASLAHVGGSAAKQEQPLSELLAHLHHVAGSAAP